MIEIVEGSEVDIDDVIRRSPVSLLPNAHDSLSAYITRSAEIWVGSANDEVACVCGLIAPSYLSLPYLWMLTTDTVDKHRFIFVRSSQIWMEGILHKYGTIFGHVERRNPKAIRWLTWLGAEFEDDGDMLLFRIAQWPIQ